MLASLIKKIFGSRNERIIKQYAKTVTKINQLETEIDVLADNALKAKTQEFKHRYANGESLDDLLPEAFAVVRAVAKRTLGLRHFDVQMIGGITLHHGKIAEMRMGEGKTLMSTLPAYLNALSGNGVHVVTVNDYLAKRDTEWMRPIYEFLGLTVGCNLPHMSSTEKRAAYAADITYGTNNEFGFDYLRDNMAFQYDDRVQRDLNFAVIDEVDSILIDEARTPLIISGPTEDSSAMYMNINALVPKLVKQISDDQPGDYTLDEKQRQVHLTENGHQHVEELMLESGLIEEGDNLYSARNITLMHHLNAALRAHNLYQNDVDYIIQDNEIVIVDEHTGRTMPGRRWSEGLHQAVEAKEGVKIQNENQTMASITFQNFFRLYAKLSGMTGTADTEAYEFQQIYHLEVVVIPTNKPMIRRDLPDLVYRTAAEKFAAVILDIKDCQQRGQPVLVGTASIEASEHLSNLLLKEGIRHQVLNAKQHEREAHIIAQAGRPGTVTIATNMAGRGTDIVLGGNIKSDIADLGDNATPENIEKIEQTWKFHHQQVLEAGGLHIIGSERHESRRIDNQLRGRSGRQGDPGSSRFYLSLEDNLMRIFAAERVSALMQKLGMEEGIALEHRWVNRIIENAQRKVEGFNFDVRKQLLQFDDVANDQRKVVYQQRLELLKNDDVSEMIIALLNEVITSLVHQYVPVDSLEEQWDIAGLDARLQNDFNLHLNLVERVANDASLHDATILQLVQEEIATIYQEKIRQVGSENMARFEKSVMLQMLDNQWREHLMTMEHLRQGIYLRGYAQKDPRQEYKREAFNLFVTMLDNFKHDVISVVLSVQIQAADDITQVEEDRRKSSSRAMTYEHADFASQKVAAEALSANQAPVSDNTEQSVPANEKVVPFVRDTAKVGRNDICPCGSGKKYKQCHGSVK